MLSSSATVRFLLSFGNVFASLILGAIAMGFFWLNYPDEFVHLQRIAAHLHEWIMARGWSTRVESILRILLEGRQLLFMGFVLAARLVVGLILLAATVVAQRLKALVVDDAPAPAATPSSPPPQ